MALHLCILIFVDGKRSQRPGPSPTLGTLGPSHQRRHKSHVSLRGPPCAHGVAGIPHGEVRDTMPIVQPALKDDITKLEVDFFNSYCDGDRVIYILAIDS